MLKSEIDAIPLEGDVSFRQRAVGLDKATLLVIEDAGATHSHSRHDFSLRGIKGYCRVRTTDAVIDEIVTLRQQA